MASCTELALYLCVCLSQMHGSNTQMFNGGCGGGVDFLDLHIHTHTVLPMGQPLTACMQSLWASTDGVLGMWQLLRPASHADRG